MIENPWEGYIAAAKILQTVEEIEKMRQERLRRQQIVELFFASLFTL